MSQHDNLMPAGSEFRSVDRRVVGFSAAVRKERFFQMARCDLIELLGQVRLRLVGVER
jgi:hypothetical protein